MRRPHFLCSFLTISTDILGCGSANMDFFFSSLPVFLVFVLFTKRSVPGSLDASHSPGNGSVVRGSSLRYLGHMFYSWDPYTGVQTVLQIFLHFVPEWSRKKNWELCIGANWDFIMWSGTCWCVDFRHFELVSGISFSLFLLLLLIYCSKDWI